MHSTDQIKIFLNKYNCKNTLVVTGNKSYEASGSRRLIEESLSNCIFYRFFEFEQNPKIDNVITGVKYFTQNNCDSIIGIGGGSVIDMSKLISSFINEDLDDISKILIYKNDFKRKVPLLVVPTTAGSGSEETSFAVLYANKVKYSVNNPTLMPDKVVLNAKLSFTMSKYQKAVSGLDAFTQGIESFWSKQSTKESRTFSLKAINLIWNNLHDSVNYNNYESHCKVVEGANYAGKAINIAKTTAPHAISYYFTSFHDIMHGHAVCLLFSKIFKYNLSKVKSADKHNKMIFDKLCQILEIDELNCEESLDKFFINLGINLNLASLGIDLEKEGELIKSSVNEERLKNNPFDINLKTILKQNL